MTSQVKVKWYQKPIGIVTCIFALLLIGGAISSAFHPKEASIATTTNVSPTSTPAPSLKAPQTLENKIKALLSDGESVSISGANDIDTNATLPGKKEVDITLNLGEGFWDTNAAKSGVWMITANLTKSIFPMDDNIYLLQITADVPTTDTYGKKQMSELESIGITRDTFNKIQWDNFDYKNIPTVADIYSEDHTIK